MTDVRSFSVGPIQENAYIVRAGADSKAAVLVDPGDEPQKLLSAAESLRVKIEAILLTHCHFDHIGAVAPVAKATGAPVYCPEIEAQVLTDVMRWVPPGFGPFESWEPEHTLKGGERLRIADLDIEVIFTPGHSPGHLTYAITPAEAAPAGNGAARTATLGSVSAGDGQAPVPQQPQPPALLSGDVLFQGSVGRVDLPGGDWPTLQDSIKTLIQRFPAQSTVFPGHMGVTTLQRELQTNPFLTELRSEASLLSSSQRQST
jgi:hydroxyacylglutathione hydrolase